MRRFFSLLLTAILFSTIVTAQSKQESTVAATVEALRKAMVEGDRANLEKFAHEGLTYGHSGGKVETKAEFVENIANGNSDFVTIDLAGQTIYIAGKTAIVRHRLNATTKDKGKEPGTVNLAILTVWVKEKKEWKMVARQAVKVI